MPAASLAPAAENFTLETRVLRLSDRTRIVEEPCIVDDQICLRTAVTHPNLNRRVAFLHDIALWPLLHMAATGTDVNGLVGLWSTHVPHERAHQIVRWLLDRQILEAI
jgi:hypothetical protein